MLTSLTIGAFDLKQRCAEWSPYDIKYRESDKKAVGSYAFESFSRYFDVIRWSFCAALLQVEQMHCHFPVLRLSPMILCAARRWILIKLRVGRQPHATFDWQTLRRLINIQQQFLKSARSQCSVSKHGALIAERVSENYYIDGAFLRGLSAQQSFFELPE